MAPLWMQSMVYFPHPSQPASILTSGQVKRTIDSLVSYQMFHWYGVVSCIPNGPVVQLPEINTEPQAAVLLPDQDYCASPWTVWLSDSTNIQHLLGYGPSHVIIHDGEVYITNVLWRVSYPCHLYSMFDLSSFAQVQVTACKQVLPFEQQLSGLILLLIQAILWGLGSPGPPRHIPFWGLGLDSPEVLVGRTTSGTWLAGATCPTIAFVGISMVQLHSSCTDR